MRWLKRLLTALLVYIGIYLPFVVIMQSVTGYDYSGAYAAVAGVGAVELIVSSLIKREETKMERKERKENHDGEGSF
jgi:multidrug transporter EmrE-like cation transporter